MADRFEDLGIAAELLAGLESLGWDEPSALQRDALPVLRRGNNVVLHASAGSGHVGAYGLGILDRLAADGTPPESASAPRAMVLVSDDDEAVRTADSLARLAAPADLSARAAATGWMDRPVDVLVTTPGGAAAAVRDSALKLGELSALVIDGLDRIHATGQWDDLETLIDITPGGAQRVVVTGGFDRRVDDFIERHVRRAMTVPPRPGDGEEEAPATGTTLGYRVVAERDKPAAIVALLEGAGTGEMAIISRTRDRAEALERDLAARGLRDRSTDDGDGRRLLVLPRTEADQRTTRADVISADVPFDAGALTALHGGGGTILVTAREREHLHRIARRGGFKLRALPDPARAGVGPAEAVRERIRALIDGGDLAADLALVQPLLDDYPAAEIAAAALHLARTGAGPTAGPGAGTPTAPRPGAGSRTAAGMADRAGQQRPGAGAPPPSDATTWTHLFFTVGSRDDVGTGDLLGAMTGEAGITGDQVGKIDIRESHTTVEVATPVAAQVIEALNGRTVKGRSMRVDYDRKTRATKKSGPGGSGGRGGRGPKRPSGGKGASGGRPPTRRGGSGPRR